MSSKMQQFIDKMLLRAEYKFDDEIKEWAGWIQGLPGIYAQRKTVEKTRNELAEILEEYLLASLRDKKRIRGFNFDLKSNKKIYSYA